MEERGGNERWNAAIANISEISNNLDSLQNFLIKKAVYVDQDSFNKASLTSDQARTIKVLEQRVETLERELDAAISAAARARTEKRQAEAGQKAAELRAQEITKELENTTKVFELHMEELRAKQDEIAKRDNEIKLLEAIIQTLGGKESVAWTTEEEIALAKGWKSVYENERESEDASINLNNTVADDDEVQEIRRPGGRDKARAAAKNKGSKASGSSTMNDDALARLVVNEMTTAEVEQREAFIELKRREVQCREREIAATEYRAQQEDMKLYLQPYDHFTGE
ncbi:hypothetical protein Tco_0456668 [Tanacetum coccineum]